MTKKVTGNYAEVWQAVRKRRQERHEEYMREIPYSDLKAMQLIVPKVPDDTILHLGNSSTIRYAQLFKWKESLKIYCNRGTSGIDGSISTAVGATMVSETPTLMIAGDLSLFYDSNALWNNYIPSSFRIIVINNQGGGIFRILPGDKNSETFDTYFETVHDLKAKPLCDLYGFGYSSARTSEETEEALRDFFKGSDKPKLLEIFTPRTVNDEVLLEYFNFVRS